MEINQMLCMNVKEPEESEWASLIVLLPKEDWYLRFYIELRKLNYMTFKEAYAILRMGK